MSKKRDGLKLVGKVKPAFNEEQLGDHHTDELEEGVPGKGPFARKYIDSLDMEFYAGGAKAKGDTATTVCSLRVADTLLSDIAVLVQSAKTPFRTNSEFIRTAILILMNYWAKKYPFLTKRFDLQDAIDLSKSYYVLDKMVKEWSTHFEKTIEVVKGESDDEIDKYIKSQLKAIDLLGGKRKLQITQRFSEILEANGIDPIPYFGED